MPGQCFETYQIPRKELDLSGAEPPENFLDFLEALCTLIAAPDLYGPGHTVQFPADTA